MAQILKKEEDVRYYGNLAKRIREAYRRQFLEDGKVPQGTKRQCRYVRPVFMGLVDREEAEQIVGQLNELCVKNGYRLSDDGKRKLSGMAV